MADAAGTPTLALMKERTVVIPAHPVTIAADLVFPDRPEGVIVFAHGSGSSRLSPRNRQVARRLNQAGFATLLLDLLTPEEELDRRNAFDVDLLTQRLLAATRWLQARSPSQPVPIGYFGASTGAAAALCAADLLGEEIGAVVCRGGRPDMAGGALRLVKAPTLLIVGGDDRAVLRLNEEAATQLHCLHELSVVAGANHLFEEPGALERVAELAAAWFTRTIAHNRPAPTPIA